MALLLAPVDADPGTGVKLLLGGAKSRMSDS
jgi:hypothetical protein